MTIYKRSVSLCRSGGPGECQSRAKLLFWVALASFFMSALPLIPCLPGERHQDFEEFPCASPVRDDSGMLEATVMNIFCTGVATASLWMLSSSFAEGPVAFFFLAWFGSFFLCCSPFTLARENDVGRKVLPLMTLLLGLVTLCVVAAQYILSIASIEVAVVSIFLPCAGLYTCIWCMNVQRDNPPHVTPTGRATMLLNIPLLGLCGARKLKSARAQEIQVARRPRKWLLRFVQDIPELGCAALDLYWFGDSWFALFDISMSALMILYFLLKPVVAACVACFWACVAGCKACLWACVACLWACVARGRDKVAALDHYVAEEIGEDP